MNSASEARTRVARRILEAEHNIRAKKWIHTWGPRMFVGSDVHGKTLGIIGLGRIGRAFVKRSHGFDMKVIYYDMIMDKGLEANLSECFTSKF